MELEALPEQLEALEEKVSGLLKALEDPDFYQGRSPDEVAEANKELQAQQAELDRAYERWSDLESRSE